MEGVEVHVLTGRLGDTLEEETIYGMHIHRIPCVEVRLPNFYPPPLVLAPTVQKTLGDLDRKYDFDVIHLQDRWFPDFDSALLYARSVRKPMVITLHNARPVGIALHYTVMGGLYDQVIGKQVLKTADRIISVSKWAIDDVSKYGIPKSRFTPIPNGVRASDYHFCPSPLKARKKPIRQALGFGSAPILLFVGRLIRQKGLDYAISAMPAILRKHPQAKLVIVGKGDKLEELERLTAKLGVAGSVKFTGFLQDSQLKELLSAADMFVLPSLWEVLPVAILEAMASGKAVVCTNAGGNKELVDRRNGLVVPKRNPKAFAQAVNSLLDDLPTLQRMGRLARKRAVKEFNWKQISQKTVKVYQRVIREGKVPKGDSGVARGLQSISDELERMQRSFGVLYSGAEPAAVDKLVVRVRRSIRMLPKRMRKLISHSKRAAK
jgi:glycosyltransferase involved in cell wall biosynthesis